LPFLEEEKNSVFFSSKCEKIFGHQSPASGLDLDPDWIWIRIGSGSGSVQPKMLDPDLDGSNEY
jgi:hypothetical protein